MSDDQFDKLFKYVQRIDKRVDEIKETMATKAEVDDLRNTVIDFAARLEDYTV